MSKARFQIYLALPDPLSFSLVTTFKDEKSKAEISQKPEAVINDQCYKSDILHPWQQGKAGVHS